MEIIGYIGALLIGMTMGFLGGGGSILAVPIFVYLLAINPVTATAYSLFVVGSTAAVGAARNYMTGMLDFKTGIVFAIPALIAVYLTRKFLIPAIPDELFSVGDFVVTKDVSIMLFFAILMLVAAISMIRSSNQTPKENTSATNDIDSLATDESLEETATPITYNYPLILLEGAVVGALTGIVGAGGGFLIIPVLVLLVKLPMKKAVGTSLMIIALKSLIGFIGDVQNTSGAGSEYVIDWSFLLVFTSLAIVGIFIGIYLSKFISNAILKRVFGWFVLVMAFYILLKEILF